MQITENTALLDLYRTMVLIRETEERIAGLMEAGEIKCPVHLCTGQEAIAAGVCSRLNATDYAFGGHRSHGHYLAKGGSLRTMIAEIYGKATGCSGGRGGSMHLTAPEVGLMGTVPLVGATISLAVGAALAAILRRDGRISASFFGDGAVEEGTFHESMNLAAHRKLPVIFVCENNLYSSHLHISERRARDNIVQYAEGHGMPGFLVDGNNAVEVSAITEEACARARRGDGPTFLECRTYRWRGHVGASWDLDVGVKRKDELDEWRKKDPIVHMEKHLGANILGLKEIGDIRLDVEQEIEKAVQFARQSPFPSPDDLLQHVWSSPNPA